MKAGHWEEVLDQVLSVGLGTPLDEGTLLENGSVISLDETCP